MGKWINTDAAYAVLTDYYHHSTDTQHAALREAFERVESVDAVPVVRCKGCKYWDAFPSSTLAPDHHECKRIRIHTTAEWFCAAGERKDGDNEQDKKS